MIRPHGKSAVPFTDAGPAGNSDAEVSPAFRRKTWVDDVDVSRARLTKPAGGGPKYLQVSGRGTALVSRAQKIWCGRPLIHSIRIQTIKHLSPPGAGGGQKSVRQWGTDHTGPHAGIFFRTTRFLDLERWRQFEKSNPFKDRRPARACEFAIYFLRCRRPRGRSKVCRISIPDRCPRNTNFFAGFEGIFFDRAGADRAGGSRRVRSIA